MWCHACIILHNLIIWIKGDTIDEQWMEELLECGQVDGQTAGELEDDSTDEDVEDVAEA